MKRLKNWLNSRSMVTILCCLPLILLLDITWVNACASLISTPSNLSVVTGFVLFTLFLFVNYHIVRYYFSRIQDAFRAEDIAD